MLTWICVPVLSALMTSTVVSIETPPSAPDAMYVPATGVGSVTWKSFVSLPRATYSNEYPVVGPVGPVTVDAAPVAPVGPVTVDAAPVAPVGPVDPTPVVPVGPINPVAP